MEGIVSAAALFGIYAALIFDIFSSLTSSPQTTELFAHDRANTLWHWVRIGALVSLVFVGFGAWLAHKEGKDYRAPILGGLVALGLMWMMYSHALKKGGGTKPGQSQSYSSGCDWL
jgi:uncharacterized membrane protein